MSDPTEAIPRTYKMIVAYDGAAFSGWQYQPNTPTVQGALERAIGQMTQSPCRVAAAGRTDAGVHASGQLASFKTTSSITCDRFRVGINALLPNTVSLMAIEPAPDGFDPRRNNKGKHYRYTIWNHRQIESATRRVAYQVYSPLDLAAMAEAAQRLVGEHDFAAFRSADCDRQTTVRLIFRLTVSHDGPRVQIDVQGTAFLKNMVRIIAGTLIHVGQGKFDVDRIDRLLETGDRRAGGLTAPAHGLCLLRVFQ